jgi:hypothetical protein
MNRNFQHLALGIFTVSLLVIASYCSYKIYTLSAIRAVKKTDYSTVNNITHGLLSVDAWKDHLILIASHRIDDFEFTKEQEKTLQLQLEKVLHAVIFKADTLLHKKQKTIGGKLKKMVANALINESKLHEQVPGFAQTILQQIKDPENKTKIKELILAKINEYGAITYDSANDVARVENILSKYGYSDLTTFNAAIVNETSTVSKEMYLYAYTEILIVIGFIFLWVICRRKIFLQNHLFTASVLLAIIILIAGLTAPMIEIDARIREMSFLLMGENLSFHDQIIYFQSKSIVDVVQVLVDTGQWDSIGVGILILIFSIVFPFAKLVGSKLYMSTNAKLNSNKLVRFFALKSGKWSMADVYVVAIFMAYIGFKGILDSQLSQLNFQTNSLASISTNETTLQPGFLLFVCYVIWGLILSLIMEKIKEPKYETPVSHSVNSVVRPTLVTKLSSSGV